MQWRCERCPKGCWHSQATIELPVALIQHFHGMAACHAWQSLFQLLCLSVALDKWTAPCIKVGHGVWNWTWLLWTGLDDQLRGDVTKMQKKAAASDTPEDKVLQIMLLQSWLNGCSGQPGFVKSVWPAGHWHWDSTWAAIVCLWCQQTVSVVAITNLWTKNHYLVHKTVLEATTAVRLSTFFSATCCPS